MTKLVGKSIGKQQMYARRFPEKHYARVAVWHAVRDGQVADPKSLLCVDCLNPAREYDHFKGYARENWFDIQPVCRSCHVEREKKRRPFCKRGHKYTERDWREVNGRKVRACRECAKLYGKPGFTPVDGRGPGATGAKHWGVVHAMHKLTEDEVRWIRANKGVLTRKAMAAKIGVGRTTVDSVLSGRTWKQLV